MSRARESSCQGLTFPLNVYARVLELAEGRAENLHYGLFDQEHQSVPAAQARSTELVFEQLPPPPCRILEVGCGLGSTLRALAERGYLSAGITPDPEQIQIARERVGDKARLECVAFEDLDVKPASFEVILLQESAQYLDPLALFNKAYQLLAENGRLLVLDEVALRRTGPGRDNLHRLPYLLNQAARCGFVLEQQTDLSRQAAPTLDYLLAAIAQHRTALRADLALSEATLDELLASLARYRRQYADGNYGYVLLRWRRGPAPRWRVTAATAADEPAIRQLFEQVFGRPMSSALLQWKYGDGRGQAMLAGGEGRLAAHYGGVSRPIRYFGRSALACQITDVMVAPAERGVLTRRGPFFLTAATFAEHFLGFGTRHLLGFGFPNLRAMRVAERLGLYAEVGQMLEVYWPPRRASRAWLITRRRLAKADAADLDRWVNPCWEAMQADLQAAIVGVRDAAWLRHRYLSHPDQDYHVMLVSSRLWSRPLGVIVLRRDDQRCELLDVVAPLKNIPRLVRAARHVASQWAVTELYGWVSSAFAPLFERCEGQRRNLDVSIPTSRWCEGPSPAELRDRWWLMSGDTDFR